MVVAWLKFTLMPYLQLTWVWTWHARWCLIQELALNFMDLMLKHLQTLVAELRVKQSLVASLALCMLRDPLACELVDDLGRPIVRFPNCLLRVSELGYTEHIVNETATLLWQASFSLQVGQRPMLCTAITALLPSLSLAMRLKMPLECVIMKGWCDFSWLFHSAPKWQPNNLKCDLSSYQESERIFRTRWQGVSPMWRQHMTCTRDAYRYLMYITCRLQHLHHQASLVCKMWLLDNGTIWPCNISAHFESSWLPFHAKPAACGSFQACYTLSHYILPIVHRQDVNLRQPKTCAWMAIWRHPKVQTSSLRPEQFPITQCTSSKTFSWSNGHWKKNIKIMCPVQGTTTTLERGLELAEHEQESRWRPSNASDALLMALDFTKARARRIRQDGRYSRRCRHFLRRTC